MSFIKKVMTLALLALPLMAMAEKKDSIGTVIDEVVWVVGDDAILRSDVETTRMQAAMEGVKWSGNPDCTIPEQIAVQKLFKHQAQIDSIEVTDADVAQEVEQQIAYWLEMVDGSRERLEEYKHQNLTQIRADLRAPKIETEEINRVKEELRNYTERVNKGETRFQTLAQLYSEDPNSARRGGELGLMGRGTLDPAFAQVAFNLTDPKKVSKIVESEFGFHIIQLIEKRGDKVNVRHILRKPVVSDEAVEKTINRLDSIAADLRAEKFSFEDAASLISDDKDTRNAKGLLSTDMMKTGKTSSKFRMQDLPAEIAKAVDTLKVGEISRAFQMINQRGKTVCVIAKLKNRIDGHRATVTEDFQILKDVVLNKRREQRIHQWVVDKIKSTYTRLSDDYKDCKFEFEGWRK